MSQIKRDSALGIIEQGSLGGLDNHGGHTLLEWSSYGDLGTCDASGRTLLVLGAILGISIPNKVT